MTHHAPLNPAPPPPPSPACLLGFNNVVGVYLDVLFHPKPRTLLSRLPPSPACLPACRTLTIWWMRTLMWCSTHPPCHGCLQDFYNLVDVYLDAVFHPRCVRDVKVFEQEGWHYELEDEKVGSGTRGWH